MIGLRFKNNRINWDTKQLHLTCRVKETDHFDKGADIFQLTMNDESRTVAASTTYENTVELLKIRHNLGGEPLYATYMKHTTIDDFYGINFLLLYQGGSAVSYIYSEVDSEFLYIYRYTMFDNVSGSPMSFTDDAAGDTVNGKYLIMNAIDKGSLGNGL